MADASLPGESTKLESSSFESSGRAESKAPILSSGESRGDLKPSDSLLILSFESCSGLKHEKRDERINHHSNHIPLQEVINASCYIGRRLKLLVAMLWWVQSLNCLFIQPGYHATTSISRPSQSTPPQLVAFDIIPLALCVRAWQEHAN